MGVMTNWYGQEGDRKGRVSVKLEKSVKEKSVVINKVKKKNIEENGDMQSGDRRFYLEVWETKKSIRQGVRWGRGRKWTLAFKKD